MRNKGVTRMANPRSASLRTLSSGVVVVHWNHGRYDYLLLRAYNYWDFPKGVVETDESPLEAAVREVEEETTLTGLRFHEPCWATTAPPAQGAAPLAGQKARPSEAVCAPSA